MHWKELILLPTKMSYAAPAFFSPVAFPFSISMAFRLPVQWTFTRIFAPFTASLYNSKVLSRGDAIIHLLCVVLSIAWRAPVSKTQFWNITETTSGIQKCSSSGSNRETKSTVLWVQMNLLNWPLMVQKLCFFGTHLFC